jgi:hypothetical protein
MSYFASVGGFQIVSGSLIVPLVGAWTADLVLAGEETLSGKVSVVIGNLTLAGAVYRSEAYGGQTKCRLVAGAGGWRTPIPVQGYGSPNGIMLSALLDDAAAACGETVNVSNDQSIGNGYARVSFASSVASDVLWHMIDLGFIPAWYVDVNGTTQTQAWPSSTVGTPFVPSNQDPAHGQIDIATEDYASWLPGCSFTHPLLSGTYTSAGVEYHWDDGGTFRFKVLTQTSSTDTGDRVLGPIQQVIQKEIAGHRLFGKYRYTTSNPSSSTIDCSPKNAKLGLPTLQNVPLQISGSSRVTPANGADCTIEFLDGYVPVCTWVDQTPTEVDIASGTNPIGYLGAQVQLFFPPVVSGTMLVGGVTPTPFTAVIPTPLTGIISQGSSVAKAPS